MAYEMTSPQGQTIMHQQLPARRCMSRWSPVTFFITAIIFFITAFILFMIGAGLMNAWAARGPGPGPGPGNYTDGNWYRAIACFVIAGLLKLSAWILLIVWCVKGRNWAQPSATVTDVYLPPVNGAYAAQPQNYFQQPYNAHPAKWQASLIGMSRLPRSYRGSRRGIEATTATTAVP